MFILTGSRASGKTYNLLRECNNNNGVVIVKDKPQKVNINEYAKDLGFENVKAMTYEEYAQGIKLSPVYIDSLEDFLYACFLGKVAGVVSNTAEVISLNPYRVIDEENSKAKQAFKFKPTMKGEN